MTNNYSTNDDMDGIHKELGEINDVYKFLKIFLDSPTYLQHLQIKEIQLGNNRKSSAEKENNEC